MFEVLAFASTVEARCRLLYFILVALPVLTVEVNDKEKKMTLILFTIALLLYVFPYVLIYQQHISTPCYHLVLT